MPGIINNPPSMDDGLCRRCRENKPILTVRTEPLCLDCFNKYVHTKVIKRMETFRTRYAEADKARYLLLPTSFGPCSVALLHILSQHLKRQSGHTGRTGFKLHVLHIKHDLDDDDIARRLEAMKQRYPEHIYSTTNLSDIVANDHFLQTTPASPSGNSHESKTLGEIFTTLPSPTSRTDTLSILLRRSAATFALQNTCEAILWSDSTTRLAERTIAETAKGRGFALPYLISDGPSPLGLPFYYPLRDLLSKEVSSYLSFLNPGLEDVVVERAVSRQSVSARDGTIDGLMGQYFESVEREYPSIVANVVRTTGKLRAKGLGEEEEERERCELCEMPIGVGGAPERSRLCYGCIRTFPQAA